MRRRGHGATPKLLSILVSLYCGAVTAFVVAQTAELDDDAIIIVDDSEDSILVVDDEDSDEITIDVVDDEEEILIVEDDSDPDVFVLDDGDEDDGAILIEEATDSDDGFAIEIDDDTDEGFSIDAEEADDEGFAIEIDDSDDEGFVIEVDESDDEGFVLEVDDADDEGFSIDDSDDEGFAIGDSDDEGFSIGDEDDATAQVAFGASGGDKTLLRLEHINIEYAGLVDSEDDIDGQVYGSAEISLEYDNDAWEVRVAARMDGYKQTGDVEFDEVVLDYGETYLRYRGDSMRWTLGAQTVIWGRIDEIPPTDFLSVQDLRRFTIDDLQDRRLARPMLRVESFWGDNAIDLIWTMGFRAAELPNEKSIWHPINQLRGEILGLESNPILSQIVRFAQIDDDAPDSGNGFGLRYTRTASAFDLALTVQRDRHSSPYFTYNPFTNTFEARHPKSWSVGGDIGIEAGGATWRAEAAWRSDVPATNAIDFSFTEVEAINWGIGVEMYPGDGDTRVNLQISGNNLLDADHVVDRDEVYLFNGDIDIPFAQERWRASMRFFVNMQDSGTYLNPELVFLGWEPHAFYVELQYFDGDDGTIGGFYEDQTVIAVGWRAEF